MPATRAARIRRLPVLAATSALLVGLVAGCADFHESAAPSEWSAQPELSPEQGPPPQIPGLPRPPPGVRQHSPTPSEVPPPNGCHDYDPAVIATCLAPVAAVAALPGTDTRPAVLAAERTGRVLRVSRGTDPVPVAHLHVDTTGGGGLTGLALSPSYAEDQLVFAYITTPTDNRVVRFAAGQPAKPILTGIPRGTKHNRGVLAVNHRGALLVATGDAGRPAAASDPRSLAGKVLRIDATGNPAQGNPTPGSAIIASGLHAPGGICSSAGGRQTWVTDRAAAQDLLYRVHAGQPLTTPAWTWPDQPGVAGCAAFPRSIMVATSVAGNVQNLPLNPDGSFSGKPDVTLSGKRGYGRLSGLDMATSKYAVAGTVNKDGGTPVSSDDRVVIIVPQSAAANGKD